MPKLKICGLFREQDIDFANEAKPDFIGFVFAEKSKRFVNAKQAETLRKKLSGEIIPVGVFVNAKIEDIVALHSNGVIDMVQLHGNESDEYIEKLKQRCDAQIIRAVTFEGQPHRATPTVAAARFCDYILLDSSTPGSGQTFNWAPLLNLDLSKNVFLAGGISLQNIGDAVKLNPFAIDVSSGAETDGVKDREKILQLKKFLY
ncbi:MAG: phosphoribosylanthranilate isomerase [Fibromonadales bacterium]|nr:phosphoribosylanthranilate isomerase [Fibromonadales bacterium]